MNAQGDFDFKGNPFFKKPNHRDAEETRPETHPYCSTQGIGHQIPTVRRAKRNEPLVDFIRTAQ